MHLTASAGMATVTCDVSAYKLNLTCASLSRPDSIAEWEIENRTRAITETLISIRDRARLEGIERLRVVVESTGRYHKLLLRIARSLAFETGLVDPSHVRKMREVLFGDDGKTDQRDPHGIAAVASQGRLIPDRQFPDVYRLLRLWGTIYQEAEQALIAAKSRVHRSLTITFPDFDFSTDFLYGPSGRAIVRCYGLDPLRIAGLPAQRIYARLRRHSNIRRSSVVRLLDSARETVAAVTRSRVTDLQARELAFAWEDFELATRRREQARRELEALYDEARLSDVHLPDPTGSGISRLALARLLGEAGPLHAYTSWRQLLKMAGLNLRERKSGKFVGQTRIARAGRPLLRAIINQMALPMVKHDRLYGRYYHHKTGVQGKPGAKAMTAVGRKIVKMIFGWYRSGATFDARRVFVCAGEHRRVA